MKPTRRTRPSTPLAVALSLAPLAVLAAVLLSLWPTALLASSRHASVSPSVGAQASQGAVALETTGQIVAERDARVAMARRLESEGRVDAAKGLYEQLLEEEPDDLEAMARLAKASLYLKDYDRAATLLDRAERIRPADPLVMAVRGLYLYCQRDTAAAIAKLTASMKADARLPDAPLILADVYFAIRNLQAARTLLTEHLKRFPGDPEGTYLLGIVAFYARDLTRARALLESSLAANPGAQNVKRDLIQIYIIQGDYARAKAVLADLSGERPHEKSLHALGQMIVQRQQLAASGRRIVRGPFKVLYPAGMDKEALERVLGILEDAYAGVCRRHNNWPRAVRVTVLESTDQLLPAYYNHVSDEITISRQYYEELDTDRKARLGRHLIFHEFAHLVFYHDLADAALPPAALWLVEGLAEYEAGGYTYTDVDYDATFADGLLELESLEEYLPVAAMGKGQVREKAYIQSYAMVHSIMESMGTTRGLAALRRMALAYTRRGPDHDGVFQEVLKTSPREFLEQLTQYIHSTFAQAQ